MNLHCNDANGAGQQKLMEAAHDRKINEFLVIFVKIRRFWPFFAFFEQKRAILGTFSVFFREFSACENV